MELQRKWKNEHEFFGWLRQKASELDILDFMLDEEVFGYTRKNLLAHTNVLDVPTEEAKIANACHIKLARLWLVQRNMVKTHAQVMKNLFTMN